MSIIEAEPEVHEATLPTLYQQQTHLSKYSRWRQEDARRETWEETVDRYFDFLREHLDENFGGIDEEILQECRSAVLQLDVLPSMRALMTAGKALKRDNAAAYNCAYIALNRVHAFDEMLYLLCCGTGVGFSVERQYINKLPEVPDELYRTDSTIVVGDSKIGWATAFRELLSMLYAGKIPNIDYSKIRPAGTRLKTFGGRASGPGPLEDLFKYTVTTFRNSTGRRLTSFEVHGICCKVGDIVVVGGQRRSALISLSNPSDDRMRDAKSGEWWKFHPHLRLANNSAAWTEKPSMERFLEEWIALIKSKSGERGIFNRTAAQKKIAALPNRDHEHEFGCNPCGEIILRDRQFCNLTQVTVRPDDTLEDLEHKVWVATVLGTIQSTFTNFRYLSKQWKKNCEEEHLLGVGFTAIQEHSVLSGQEGTDILDDWLGILSEVVDNTNEKFSEELDIEPSAAKRCIKPAGNSTQLIGAHGSGLHDMYAEFYWRRVRISKLDPIGNILYMAGVPCEDDTMSPDTTWVFSFPMKAPKNGVKRNDRYSYRTP